MRFVALDVSFAFVRTLRKPLERLRSVDPDLYRQLRRAAASIPLNLAEGASRQGKDRRHHFRVAHGSALEAGAALRVAEAWGDLDADVLQPALETLDRLLGLLWGLTR